MAMTMTRTMATSAYRKAGVKRKALFFVLVGGTSGIRLALPNQTLVRQYIGLCVFERFSSIRFFRNRAKARNRHSDSATSEPCHSTTTTPYHFGTSAVARHSIQLSPSHSEIIPPIGYILNNYAFNIYVVKLNIFLK